CSLSLFLRLRRPPPRPTLFPYTALFRSCAHSSSRAALIKGTLSVKRGEQKRRAKARLILRGRGCKASSRSGLRRFFRCGPDTLGSHAPTPLASPISFPAVLILWDR